MQIGQMLQKQDILLGNGIQQQGIHVPAVIAAAEGHAVDYVQFRPLLPQQFQGLIIGTAFGVDGFQLTGIGQHGNILLRKGGQGNRSGIVCQNPPLKGNVPADFAAGHFFAELIKVRPSDFLPPQIQRG